VKDLLNEGLSVTGNALWKRLEADNVVDRTWQSIKDRFLKILQPRITDPEMLSLLRGRTPIGGAILNRKRPVAPVVSSPAVTPEPVSTTSSTSNKRNRVAVNNNDDDDDDDDEDIVDPKEVSFANACINVVGDMFGVPRDVAVHALLCCSGNAELAGQLLVLGPDGMRERMEKLAKENGNALRDDQVFTFADDVMLRDGDAQILTQRSMDSIRSRWRYLEMPESAFPFS
jgi:hypothetical protein